MAIQIDKQHLITIIQGDAVKSAERTVSLSKEIGERCAENGVSTSQIRTIFSKVRQIEMYWPADKDDYPAGLRDLMLLKPKMAYQTERKKELRELTKVLADCIDLVSNRVQFQRFADFFEAILAYHKAAGGK